MKLHSFFFSLALGCLITLFNAIVPLPSQAYIFTCPISSPTSTDSSSFTFATIPENWKRVFPFDLVYPITPIPTTPLSISCTEFTVFGYTRCLETPRMIAQGVKNIVLIKLAIDLIIAL